MANVIQKMILTASYNADGDIAIGIDFFPKMPKDIDAYNKLPVEKQGLVAIVNQFAKQNEMIVKNLMSMAEPTPSPAAESATEAAKAGK